MSQDSKLGPKEEKWTPKIRTHGVFLDIIAEDFLVARHGGMPLLADVLYNGNFSNERGEAKENTVSFPK